MTDKHCSQCNRLVLSVAKYCKFCGSELALRTYPGFWIRLGSYAIDLIGILIATVILGILIAMFGGDIDTINDTVLGYLGYFFYSVGCLTVFSTTFGKSMYGLKVINEEGSRVNFNQALVRSFLQPFSTLLFGIGYLNINNNMYGQAWHDRLSKTVVVMRLKNLSVAYFLTLIGTLMWIWLSYLGSTS